MEYSLRIANAADAAQINDIYAYYIQNTVSTFNEVNKSVEVRAKEIEDILAGYPFYVAEADGRILGFACAEPVRPQTGYRFSVELTIYLHPDTPKHAGIGGALYDLLLPTLTAQGYRAAYAVISGTNEASIAFHRHYGFQELARFEKSGYKHGMWLDAVWMRKALNSFDDQPQPPVPFSQYRQTI